MQSRDTVLGLRRFRIGSTALGFHLASLPALLAAPPALVPLTRALAETDAWASFDIHAFCMDFSRMRADSDHTYLWIYTDGSFTPASGGRPAFAGWAAVCIDPFRQQVSLASGPVLADPEWGDEAPDTIPS